LEKPGPLRIGVLTEEEERLILRHREERKRAGDFGSLFCLKKFQSWKRPLLHPSPNEDRSLSINHPLVAKTQIPSTKGGFILIEKATKRIGSKRQRNLRVLTRQAKTESLKADTMVENVQGGVETLRTMIQTRIEIAIQEKCGKTQ
jgi:hypothetical protein